MTKEHASKRYKRGARFEYQVGKLFKDAGYVVIRSAGSHTEYDLVAISRNSEYQRPRARTIFMDNAFEIANDAPNGFEWTAEKVTEDYDNRCWVRERVTRGSQPDYIVFIQCKRRSL